MPSYAARTIILSGAHKSPLIHIRTKRTVCRRFLDPTLLCMASTSSERRSNIFGVENEASYSIDVAAMPRKHLANINKRWVYGPPADDSFRPAVSVGGTFENPRDRPRPATSRGDSSSRQHTDQGHHLPHPEARAILSFDCNLFASFFLGPSPASTRRKKSFERPARVYPSDIPCLNLPSGIPNLRYPLQQACIRAFGPGSCVDIEDWGR